MTKDDVKNIVLEIIEEIAPDEDLTDVKPDVRLVINSISTRWIST